MPDGTNTAPAAALIHHLERTEVLINRGETSEALEVLAWLKERAANLTLSLKEEANDQDRESATSDTIEGKPDLYLEASRCHSLAQLLFRIIEPIEDDIVGNPEVDPMSRENILHVRRLTPSILLRTSAVCWRTWRRSNPNTSMKTRHPISWLKKSHTANGS